MTGGGESEVACRACERPAHPTPASRGLCLGHALIFQYGLWDTVEEYLLTRPTARQECNPAPLPAE